jgi:16S rRNA G1207 methylase RsmC
MVFAQEQNASGAEKYVKIGSNPPFHDRKFLASDIPWAH